MQFNLVHNFAALQHILHVVETGDDLLRCELKLHRIVLVVVPIHLIPVLLSGKISDLTVRLMELGRDHAFKHGRSRAVIPLPFLLFLLSISIERLLLMVHI